jgi:hypothetical protein
MSAALHDASPTTLSGGGATISSLIPRIQRPEPSQVSRLYSSTSVQLDAQSLDIKAGTAHASRLALPPRSLTQSQPSCVHPSTVAAAACVELSCAQQLSSTAIAQRCWFVRASFAMISAPNSHRCVLPLVLLVSSDGLGVSISSTRIIDDTMLLASQVRQWLEWRRDRFVTVRRMTRMTTVMMN